MENSSSLPASSCLEKVVMTFILLFAAIVLLGAAMNGEAAILSSSDADCQISERFPGKIRQWCGLITRHAQANNLQPDLVAALILQESGGNSRAYSHSGAVGLMQVMPNDGLAADFMCKGVPCFEDRPSIRQLQDPEFNVRYGTGLLQDLVKHHNGNLREALRDYGPMDVGYGYADIVLSLYQEYRQP